MGCARYTTRKDALIALQNSGVYNFVLDGETGAVMTEEQEQEISGYMWHGELCASCGLREWLEARGDDMSDWELSCENEDTTERVKIHVDTLDQLEDVREYWGGSVVKWDKVARTVTIEDDPEEISNYLANQAEIHGWE